MGDHERLRHSCQKGQMLLFKPGDLLFGKEEAPIPRQARIRPFQLSLVNVRSRSKPPACSTANSSSASSGICGMTLFIWAPVHWGLYFNTSSSLLRAISLSPGSQAMNRIQKCPLSFSSRCTFENLCFIKVHEALAGQNRIKGMIREIHALRRADHIVDVQSRFLRQPARLLDLVLGNIRPGKMRAVAAQVPWKHACPGSQVQHVPTPFTQAQSTNFLKKAFRIDISVFRVVL